MNNTLTKYSGVVRQTFQNKTFAPEAQVPIIKSHHYNLVKSCSRKQICRVTCWGKRHKRENIEMNGDLSRRRDAAATV